MSNPIGTRYDAYAEDALYGFIMDGAWGSGTLWDAAAARDDRGWTVEMRVPFSDMDAGTPRPGDLFSFQVIRFCRTMFFVRKGKKGRGFEYSSWAPGGNFRRPDRFGYLLFSGRFSELENRFLAAARKAGKPEYTVETAGGASTYISYEEFYRKEIERAKLLVRNAVRTYNEKAALLLEPDRKRLSKEVEEIRAAGAKAAEAIPRTISEEVDIIAKKVAELSWQLRLAELVGSYSVKKGVKK